MPADPHPSLWYEESGSVRHRFNGVFEGGGAKGVAFVGALSALRKRHCWFKSVAGASAGAITAALVAAGLSPEEIDQTTRAALSRIKTGFLIGLVRLASSGGFFPRDDLRQFLKTQINHKLGLSAEDDPTFAQLYAFSRIELNVVAASLSMKSYVIFSHLDTPNCSVVDAVIASSSIPVAFEDNLLAVPFGGDVWHQTIVDGGVWSNFPIFIYDDSNFRAHFGREPISDNSSSIIGFVLDESRDASGADSTEEQQATKVLRGSEVRFVERPKSFKPWENVTSKGPQVASLPLSVIDIFPWLLGSIGRMFGNSDVNDPIRMPTPRANWARHVQDMVSGFLSAFGFGYIVLAFAAFFLVLNWSAVGFLQLVTTFYEWAGTYHDPWMLPTLEIDSIAKWFITWTLQGGLLLMFCFLILMFVHAFTLFVIVALLRRPIRRLGYGLVSTFVAGSGVRDWARRDPRIVFLPVGTIGTISFDEVMVEAASAKLRSEAMKETERALEAILGAAHDDKLRPQ